MGDETFLTTRERKHARSTYDNDFDDMKRLLETIHGATLITKVDILLWKHDFRGGWPVMRAKSTKQLLEITKAKCIFSGMSSGLVTRTRMIILKNQQTGYIGAFMPASGLLFRSLSPVPMPAHGIAA